jgi:hypothetical protein
METLRPSGVTVKLTDRTLSPLVVHRHTDDLSDVGRWLLRRAETEIIQDPADRDRVGDVGRCPAWAAGRGEIEPVGIIGALQQDGGLALEESVQNGQRLPMPTARDLLAARQRVKINPLWILTRGSSTDTPRLSACLPMRVP